MLTLVAQAAACSRDVNGLPDEEFLFMGGDRFGSTQRNVSFRIARDSAGDVVGLTWSSRRKGTADPAHRSALRVDQAGHGSEPVLHEDRRRGASARSRRVGTPCGACQHLTPGARTNLRPAGPPARWHPQHHVRVGGGCHRAPDRTAWRRRRESAVLSDRDGRASRWLLMHVTSRRPDHRLRRRRK